MHIYHYHAFYQELSQEFFQASGTYVVTHLDGVLFREEKIVSWDQYKTLKKEIDPDNFDKLTIATLTYLGEN